MINNEDVIVTKRPMDLREGCVEVRAEVPLTQSYICDDDGEEIAYREEEARRQVWQHLYGELAADIERLRGQVLPHMMAFAQHSAMEEFDKITKKLRVPETVRFALPPSEAVR